MRNEYLATKRRKKHKKLEYFRDFLCLFVAIPF